MSIKAKFPSGVTSITLSALHQWDCGQVLEIESDDPIPSLVEVHFSCIGMADAEVRVCAFADNDVATVEIPDSCLEQTANITAWLYEKDGNSGRTAKSITIPIIARARPNRPAEIPASVSDCYSQLITEVNEAIGALRSGTVTAKNAENAENAKSAQTATSATTATTAQSANTANSASVSDKSSVISKSEKGWITGHSGLSGPGLYVLRFTVHNESHTHIVYYDPAWLADDGNMYPFGPDVTCGSEVFCFNTRAYNIEEEVVFERMYFGILDADGKLKVHSVVSGGGEQDVDLGYNYSYIQLMELR